MRVPGETSCKAEAGAPCSSHKVGDDNAAKTTPRHAIIGGVNFYRSKNGNLYREGIIRAQRYDPTLLGQTYSTWRSLGSTDTEYHRRNGLVKKVDMPCREFSTTGTSFPLEICSSTFINMTLIEVGSSLDMLTFVPIGSCIKGPRCRYIHDPTKVAICNAFLQKGICSLGESCDLSHDSTPERSPACLHFARGHCSNDKCHYSHVNVSPTALVCRDFGIYGYCEKGAICTERHVNECPDFSNTGVCNTKCCKLMHRHKAAVIRRNTAEADDQTSDLSSDEELEEIDSDDVDSDELEYVGDGESVADSDILMQRDYVHL